MQQAKSALVFAWMATLIGGNHNRAAGVVLLMAVAFGSRLMIHGGGRQIGWMFQRRQADGSESHDPDD